jgi:hypothetical protein
MRNVQTVNAITVPLLDGSPAIVPTNAAARSPYCGRSRTATEKNTTAASVNIAVSPVRKMLDKAECDQHSVSHLLSPVVVRKEGEREKSLYEPDFMTTDRLMAQTHIKSPFPLSDGSPTIVPTNAVPRSPYCARSRTTGAACLPATARSSIYLALQLAVGQSPSAGD